jgi:hypothetical protein
MKETAEREIKIGMERNPKKVVGEIEKTARQMAARGWRLANTVTDEVMGSVFLFFERELGTTEGGT